MTGTEGCDTIDDSNDERSATGLADCAVTFLGDAFCAGVPLRQALDVTRTRYGDTAWTTTEMQRALVDATLGYGDALASRTPGFSFGAARCSRFLRLILDEIDHCAAPVDELLITRAAELCTCIRSAPRSESGRSIDGRERVRWIALRVPPRKDQDRVLLRVADAFSELAMCVWDAGVCMYAHIVNARSPVHARVSNARVLELGAGTGICASAFKKAGSSHVLMTDLPQALNNLRVNVNANDAGDVVSVKPLDFTNIQDVVRTVREGNFCTVVAADVTYDEGLVRAIVLALCAVLEDGVAKTAYLFATRRNPNSFALLRSLLNETHLNVFDVHVNSVDDAVFEYLVQWDSSSVSVLCVQRHS